MLFPYKSTEPQLNYSYILYENGSHILRDTTEALTIKALAPKRSVVSAKRFRRSAMWSAMGIAIAKIAKIAAISVR